MINFSIAVLCIPSKIFPLKFKFVPEAHMIYLVSGCPKLSQGFCDLPPCPLSRGFFED